MYRNIRRVADLVLKTRSKYSRVIENGSCVTHGQNVSQYRSYLLLRHYQGQHAAKTAYKKMEFPFRSSGLYRNYSTMYAGNTARFHAQTAWKRINQMYSYNSSSVPTIGRIAQAFSLASTRSHLIVPGVLAFLFGELALADKTHAESYLSSRNSACMHPEYSNLFFGTLVSFAAESLVLLFRALYLSVLFLPSLITAPFADSFGPEFRKLWLQLVHHTLEKAGPAFIKWGQWAATRPDLFPRDLCIELAKLQSSAPEHSFEYTKKSIEGAFGRKISEIFESFEENPVASGSIAQVHRAVLRYRYPDQKIKPMDVAVKVRHPGVGESIRRDFAIINTIAKISKFIPPLNWLRLDESVQQFAVFMMSQVDLAREAAHLNRFIYNFRRWKDVSFPKPVYPLVHPAVLVESYEQGESVAHYVEDIEGQPCVKAALAHIGTNALLKMLLVDNFVHADLHPGNILVRVAPSKSPKKKFSKSKPHVVFLDVGMTAELSKGDQTNVVEFFKAVARRDGRTAAECTLRLSKNQNCPNPEAFIKEVEQSFSFWGTPEGDVVHPAECMQNLLEQVRRHRVNIDGNVCTVMVTTLVLEGWQRKLDPDYDVMSTLQKLLGKADWAESLSYTMEQLV